MHVLELPFSVPHDGWSDDDSDEAFDRLNCASGESV